MLPPSRGLTVVREQQKKKAAVRQGDAETLAAGADPAEALEDAEAHTLATALQRLKEEVRAPAAGFVCGTCTESFADKFNLTRHQNKKKPCVAPALQQPQADVRKQQIKAAKATYQRSSPGKAKQQTADQRRKDDPDRRQKRQD